MDAAEAMNHIARAIEEAMGDLVNSQEGAPPRGPWLPLSVRYAAAEAAAKVVIEWREDVVFPGPSNPQHVPESFFEDLSKARAVEREPLITWDDEDPGAGYEQTERTLSDGRI